MKKQLLLWDIGKSLNYVAEPHGAIGYLALKNYLKGKKQTHKEFSWRQHTCKIHGRIISWSCRKIGHTTSNPAVIDLKKEVIAISNYDD